LPNLLSIDYLVLSLVSFDPEGTSIMLLASSEVGGRWHSSQGSRCFLLFPSVTLAKDINDLGINNLYNMVITIVEIISPQANAQCCTVWSQEQTHMISFLLAIS